MIGKWILFFFCRFCTTSCQEFFVFFLYCLSTFPTIFFLLSLSRLLFPFLFVWHSCLHNTTYTYASEEKEKEGQYCVRMCVCGFFCFSCFLLSFSLFFLFSMRYDGVAYWYLTTLRRSLSLRRRLVMMSLIISPFVLDNLWRRHRKEWWHWWVVIRINRQKLY